ncbi:MAG: 1-acyl-sn-glycerol-3-phosphate acyltransferase [Candidatus Angelobacter sp.]
MNALVSQVASASEVPVIAPAQTLAILSAKNNSLTTSLLNEFFRLRPEWRCFLLDDGDNAPADLDGAVTSCIFVPSLTTRDCLSPDLGEARRLFETTSLRQVQQFVLISSALIYGTGPGRQGFVTENHLPHPAHSSSISEQWGSLETLVRENLEPATTLTILRPAIVLAGKGLFPGLFSRWFVPSLPGHDPVLQFLSLSDLAAALICAVRANKAGIFNVAPDYAIPLHHATRLGKAIRLPVPRTLRRTIQSKHALDFLRYSWTISNAGIKKELGFAPSKSSLAALQEFRNQNPDPSAPEPQFDRFGMDEDYIRFYGKSLFKFLSEYYWRIEDKGLENIPRQGPAVMVGMHRGFMPWDGVMALHTIVKKTGRYPRFLTHPALLKFPFLANFMTKLGGVVACQESAEHVLASDGLLGIFPEGIHGAFTLYRDTYKLQAFGRDVFVKLAIRHRAPIIPFVTVGSAEMFPIFGKIKSRLWTRYAGWPFIPITPTFPVLPVPLPSKWHTQVLPAIHIKQYPPEAAEDRAVVKAVSRQVRAQMQQAIDEMVSRRRSIFFGSIFERRKDESQSKPAAV